MSSPLPPQLLLTAGDANSVRRQLGVHVGDEIKALDLTGLPLSAGVRQQIDHWAATFVDLCRSGESDPPGMSAWGELGFAVASALAGELGPDVQLRFVADSVFLSAGDRLPVHHPVAGLFDDVLALPIVPVHTGWSAYQTTLTLDFGRGAGVPEPPAAPWLTASATDATDDELRELRRRAVDPVVRSLLTPGELATARIILYREDGNQGISLWVAAVGEEMQHWIHLPDIGAPWPADPVDVAAVLADRMEDWVCETRFAWGQHRIASYQVPPPR